MDITKELLKEKAKTEELIRIIEKKLPEHKMIAEGKKLACTTSHGISQYFIDGKYVSKKDLSTATGIANYKYSEELLSYAYRKLNAINDVLSFYSEKDIDSLYEKQCKGRKELITPYFRTKADFINEWIEEKYVPYDRWEDVRTEFYTVKGERVRSKSEMLIANELARYDIPYRYEYPLEIKDGDRRVILHPDFIALNRRTCREFVIEHLGMMDKISYCNSNLYKIDLLEKNGFLLGINLILLHETSDNPLNTRIVKEYIEEYLT